jgi:class 3 adenylate cyclase
MIPSLRYLATWLWITLIGWAVLLVLLWGPGAWLLSDRLGIERVPPGLVAGLAILAWVALAAGGAFRSRQLEAKGGVLDPMERFAGFVRLLLLFGVLGLALRGVLAVLPERDDLALTGWLDIVFEPAWAGIESILSLGDMPFDMGGVPVAPVALFVVLILGGNALRWRLDRMHQAARAGRFAVPGASRATDELTEEELVRARAVERKIALSSYSEAKKLLESTEMELTFLSLDVVGSTAMKKGEDPYVIEQSFGDYRKLVQRALRRHGAWKQTWTPDGQMAAFRTPTEAVQCGREVIRSLDEFNREVSRLQLPFRVRAGAHLGTVSVDEETPMEAISDSAIDITGHLQKYAAPDSLWISEALLERLDESEGFRPEERDVDGKPVHSWTPSEA